MTRWIRRKNHDKTRSTARPLMRGEGRVYETNVSNRDRIGRCASGAGEFHFSYKNARTHSPSRFVTMRALTVASSVVRAGMLLVVAASTKQQQSFLNIPFCETTT